MDVFCAAPLLERGQFSSMRADMYKVIVERPRRGKRTRPLAIRFRNDLDSPAHLGNTASVSMTSGVYAFAGRTQGPKMWKLSTTTDGVKGMSIKNGMRPVHPGEVLREDFLRPAGLSVNALAKALHVPTPRINDVVRERRGVTADTALRLARHFRGRAPAVPNISPLFYTPLSQITHSKKIHT